MSVPANRLYLGNRSGQAGPATVIVMDDPSASAKSRYLDPRRDLRNHSPDGFQWGYAGSGPAQLALALCADALDDDARAQQVYQDFKFAVIARISGDTWEMSAGGITAEVEQIEAKSKRIA